MATPEEQWYAAVKANEDAKAAAAGLDPTTMRVMQNYGYLAGYLGHPEIGPLLREAATKGWSKEILQGKLFQTSWWQNQSAGARELDVLSKTDPAEFRSKVHNKAMEIQQMATAGGAAFESWDEVLRIAQQVLSDPSMTPQTMQYMVFAHAHYRKGDTFEGTLGTGMDSIKARASEYMVPISDSAAFEWAKKIAQGTVTQDAAEQYLKNQAKSRFGHLAEDIDRGFTIKQLFDPFIQQTAQLLEISPDQVDLMDPKWMSMIDVKDKETGKRRQMTLAEAGEFVRSSAAYDETQGATNRAAQFAENIAQQFGKVKA